MLTNEELYAGFSREKMEQYDREARQRYGDSMVNEVNKRVRKMSKAQWQTVKQEGEDIARQMAGLMDLAVDDPDVQRMVSRHHAWIENFYEAPACVYRGLAELYVAHADFCAFYDKYRPGLAQFLKAAMEHYCATVIGEA